MPCASLRTALVKQLLSLSLPCLSFLMTGLNFPQEGTFPYHRQPLSRELLMETSPDRSQLVPADRRPYNLGVQWPAGSESWCCKFRLPFALMTYNTDGYTGLAGHSECWQWLPTQRVLQTQRVQRLVRVLSYLFQLLTLQMIQNFWLQTLQQLWQ